MLFIVLKHVGQWDFLAMMFKIEAPMFERMITTILEIVSDFAYTRFVAKVLEK